MTDLSAADSRWPPRGLIVVLRTTGLLVTTLALQQFSSIIAPVALGLVLVVGFHPLTGILRHHRVPVWLAVTTTLLTLLLVIVGLAASLALSVARLASVLPTYQASFAQMIEDLRARPGSLGSGSGRVPGRPEQD